MIPMFRQRFNGTVRATDILPCGHLDPLFLIHFFLAAGPDQRQPYCNLNLQPRIANYQR
jgi:hypothetical protein